MTLGILLFGSATGALLAADPVIANDAVKAPARVIVIGDSITAGYGLDPTEAYPALLQKKADAEGLSATIVNAGVSGDTTAGGLRRINWALGQGADVVILALGGNDGLRGVAPKETEANLAKMVDQAKAKAPAAVIIIAGMQMPPSMGEEYARDFSALFSKVATDKKTELVPFLLAGVGGDPKLNQADRIHPNVEGQKIVADNIWKVLQGVLKSRTATAAAK
ncbi:MAG: lipolytic protein family [Akkermansiaceae bacterium]|nr:lipolytic protein family [Akkermansiaceae bacterium]